MPSRSTSSPPSQPVTSARPVPTSANTNAIPGGLAGSPVRSHQLTANSTNTTTFPSACHSPTDFARVRDGIPSQSIKPKMAATSPLKRLELGPVAYRFKDRLANTPHPIAYGFAGLDSPVTLLRAAQYGLRKAAENLPLGRASHWPGKAMRRLDLWRGLG